jgi:UDP-N-acetylglucosamine acyltransferase
MKSGQVHPQSFVEEGAIIGKNVTIEPFATIRSGVVIEDNVTIKSHAYIEGNTTIGAGTTIYPFASIGTKSQNLKFRGENTFVKIGKNCQIRECVTINASSGENTAVEVGDNCFIMAYCHIAHNCTLGNSVIMSNNATLAGHVIVEDNAIIGGMTPVHQFVRIGKFAMVGGMSRVPYDIPPYTIGAGIPYKFGGLNLVGLKRNGINLATRSELSKCFKLLYRSKLHLDEAIKRMEQEIKPLPEVLHFLQFCKASKRGLIGLQGVMHGLDDPDVMDLLEVETSAELACTSV